MMFWSVLRTEKTLEMLPSIIQAVENHGTIENLLKKVSLGSQNGSATALVRC